MIQEKTLDRNVCVLATSDNKNQSALKCLSLSLNLAVTALRESRTELMGLGRVCPAFVLTHESVWTAVVQQPC